MRGRRPNPKCDVCNKPTEKVGSEADGTPVFGCKTPKKCGWKEYHKVTDE